jgi:beta-aspartyl-peptidase (threonine type)
VRDVRATRLAIALALAATAACASASGGEAGRAGVGAGDPGPAIRKVLDDQVLAWNRGDIEAFMEGYWNSEDLIFTSGGNVQRGWRTTLERYRASYGTSPETMGRLSFSELEIHPLGADAAWALGRWRLDYESGEAPGGVFSLVFRRFDGRWLIVHDHTSSSP